MIEAPFWGRDSHQLGEFNVVADQDRDDAAVRVEDVDLPARRDAPPLPLARGDVNLVLLAERTVAAEQVGDVVQVALLDDELRPADDVDVELDRELGEQVEVLGSELREATGCLARACLLDAGEELRREQFRKENEVALVLAGGVGEELALLGELVEPGSGTHLVLDHRQPHRFGGVAVPPLRPVTVVKIRPFQIRCVAAARLVGREVVGDHPLEREFVRNLRRQNGVEQRLVHYVFNVLAGGHLVGVSAVAGNATGDDDAGKAAHAT